MSNKQTALSKHNAIRALVEGALFVAIAEILGFIKIWHMPEGGSVSLMMAPMVIYALRWGVRQGLLAGLAMGVVDFMIAGGLAIGWQSILGDYVIALTLLGLAGVGHKKGMPGIVLGSALGCLGRFLTIWATGAVVWGEYMYDIYGFPMTNEWVYSFLYNLPVLISGVLTVVVCIALYQMASLRKYLLGQDIV